MKAKIETPGTEKRHSSNAMALGRSVIVVTIIIALAAVAAWFVFQKISRGSQWTFFGEQKKSDVVSTAQPTRIVIPKIGVKAAISLLGLNPDQTLEVPKKFEDVGWYVGSPVPGNLGPSVMVGHLDAKTGPAVFYDLHKLVPGDEVEITRQDGSVVKFKVNSVERYKQDAFPTEKVYGNIDHAGLRLITCTGEFNSERQRYSENLVVYATLVTE